MNKIIDLEDVPFVNEECGDTMWDESRLDQLTESTTSQQVPVVSTPVRSPIEQGGDTKTSKSKQDSQ
jgi:hypothetical protein